MSPEELAKHFCNMTTYECVKFLNKVGDIEHVETSPSFSRKAKVMIDSNELTVNGRLVLHALKQRRSKIDDPEDKWRYTE